MAIKKLLFIDTNIFLDQYRVRNEAALKLLFRAEKVSEQIIATYQLEIEFKKNRQAVMIDSLKALKAPSKVPTPGMLSDAKATKLLSRGAVQLEKHIERLKKRLLRALDNPTVHDPVYRVCQRLFHLESPLVLHHEDKRLKRLIRARALRRFLHGCPPRKSNDTSIGDAINWEWMLHCAEKQKAELVICSRDADYGSEFDGKVYVNDHLKQEFKDRVSQRRKLVLHTKLSDALKELDIAVTKQEEQAETEIVVASQVNAANWAASTRADMDEFIRKFGSKASKGWYQDIEIPHEE